MIPDPGSGLHDPSGPLVCSLWERHHPADTSQGRARDEEPGALTQLCFQCDLSPACAHLVALEVFLGSLHKTQGSLNLCLRPQGASQSASEKSGILCSLEGPLVQGGTGDFP